MIGSGKRALREGRLGVQSAVFRGDGMRRPRAKAGEANPLLRDLQCAMAWEPGDWLPRQVEWNVRQARRAVPARRAPTERERREKFPIGRRPGEAPLCESRAWKWRRVLEVAYPVAVVEEARAALAAEVARMSAGELLAVLREPRVNLWDPALKFVEFLAEFGLSLGGPRVVR